MMRQEGMKKLVNLLALSIAVLPIVITIFSHPCWASANEIQVEVKPDSLKLVQGVQYKAVVVVRNQSQEPFHKVKLSCLNANELIEGIEVPSQSTLIPNDALIWTLTIAKRDFSPLPDLFYIKVEYQKGEAPAAKILNSAAFCSIKLEKAAYPSFDEICTIEIKKSTSTIMEYRPCYLYFLITNNSNQPIKLKDVVPTLPGFIKAEKDNITEKTLYPRQTFLFPIKLSTEGQITPGNHIFTFEVKFQWQENNSTKEINKLIQQELQVGILGESEILVAMGIPSLLFLPGFLMMITWKLLFKNRFHKKYPLIKPETLKDIFTFKGPVFWFFAVPGSVVMALLYPVITGIFGNSRDYLYGYELIDVIGVWGWSIIIAFLLYIVIFGFIFWGKMHREKRNTISGKDKALDVLEKIYRNIGEYELEDVDVTTEGIKRKGFLVEFPQK